MCVGGVSFPGRTPPPPSYFPCDSRSYQTKTTLYYSLLVSLRLSLREQHRTQQLPRVRGAKCTWGCGGGVGGGVWGGGAVKSSGSGGGGGVGGVDVARRVF